MSVPVDPVNCSRPYSCRALILQAITPPYQEVFFENGNLKVAARNNAIFTLKETEKRIYTVKD